MRNVSYKCIPGRFFKRDQHIPRQKSTHPDTVDGTLSPQHETAVALLASSKSSTDTSKVIEVTWQTMNEWRHHHPGFQAAMQGSSGLVKSGRKKGICWL